MQSARIGYIAMILSFLFTLKSPAAVPSDEKIAASIQKHRTAELVVLTRPGAHVEVAQIRHAFLFGTCLSDIMWAQPEDFQVKRNWSPDLKYMENPDTLKMIEANREKFFRIVKENFNYAVHRNCAKWFITEYEGPGNYYYTPADRIYLWCRTNDIPMRGHCVFWGLKDFNPPWLTELSSEEEMRWRMQVQAYSVLSRYRGYIDEWDLNNEMLHHHWYESRLGEDIIDNMFLWAKQANPQAVLYVNEFDVIDGKLTNAYVEQIQGFLDRGLPVGGIGCQAHFYNENLDFDKISESLDKLSKFNLPIKITELSMSVKDEEIKAKRLDQFLRLCYSKPAVSAIVFWGFWEEIQWLPQATLWKKDWTITPAGQAYRNLVFGEWWTNEKGTADEKGIYRVRGHLGDYKITVSSEGEQKELQAELRREGKTVEVSWP
jgi:GH35 family endo-1,4-beta-xylanase